MSFETFISDVFVEKKIKEYFVDNLKQYCEGDDAWKIHWNPVGTIERPDDLYWLDLHFVTNEPFQRELGTYGRNHWSGFLQVRINTPLDEADLEGGDSVNSAMNHCYEDIARVFRRGTIFNGIRIIKTCRYTSAMQVEDDFCSLPVRIYWEADLSN